MLHKDIEGEGRIWHFLLTLCNENVLTLEGGWVVLKSLKTPIPNIKMATWLEAEPFKKTIVQCL